ncbi:MAG: tRNA (adenosine(37)-N6)-threonylcarbamoyltransferase complex dimerization subunit type 1 TsaB [Candidatus Rokubacteria bacterium]|nr:tRNA (adenosine(37)-N6)-threonylcarbamoyltransferase complex dimerization subunit type 1 TsaB [Candidatus Rokubacteria bacterium]
MRAAGLIRTLLAGYYRTTAPRPGALGERARLALVRVLAVETSTLAGGVALLDGERVVAESLLDVRATHSERLMVTIDQALGGARWTARDLEGLAVAVGPGSFTGLRIGLSTVKGLALALGVPVAAVPTLDGLAASLPFAALPVCPVLDARKGEVYASLYRWDGVAMRREWEYLALAPDDLSARLAEPVILVGDGAASIRSPYARIPPAHRRVPSPASVGHLGLARLRAGDTVPPADLTPLYLRPSEAELKRRALAVH